MDYTNLPTSLNVPSQLPLDHKMFIESEELLSEPSTLEMRAFTYFQGLKITCLKEMVDYEWKPVAEYEQDALLPQAFKYPASAPIVGGINYANKYFNFYKISTLKRSEIEELIPTPPVQLRYNAESLGEGTPILDSTVGQTFKFRTIASKSLDVSVNEEGLISIEQVETSAGLQLFYVNANYRGIEEEGTQSKPFKKLTDVLTKVIGDGDAGDPDIKNVEIILQSNMNITQADFNNNPKLEGRLSVNTVHLTSDDDINLRTVTVQSNIDYPIDTEFLINKVGVNSGGYLNRNVNIRYSNINMIVAAANGLVRHLSLKLDPIEANRRESSMRLTNFKIACTKPDDRYTKVFKRDGSEYILFGGPIYKQTSIPLTTPHVMIKGHNGVGSSNIIMERVNVLGKSQVVLNVIDAAMDFRTVDISTNSRYLNATQGVDEFELLPKEGYSKIIIDSSYTRGLITSFEHHAVIGNTYLGGDDVFLTLRQSVVNATHSLNSLSFELYAKCANYFVDVASEARNFILENTDTRPLRTLKGFAKSDTSRTSNFSLHCSNSILDNVKNPSVNKIRYIASKAIINGADYTSNVNFASDTQAIEGGLIPGNLYYNTTTNSVKKIT